MSDRQAWFEGAAFRCAVGQLADGCVIRLHGELDMAARPALEQALETALADDGPEVSLDLDAVTFADSSIVAWLLSADTRIRARRGRLTIVACSPTVRDLLRLTGIEGRIPFVDGGSMP